MRSTQPEPVAGSDKTPTPPANDPDYWFGLIADKVASGYLNVTVRLMQKMRQNGDGPRYIRLSSRCIRYRRIDLREWSEARIRTSTADPGEAA